MYTYVYVCTYMYMNTHVHERVHSNLNYKQLTSNENKIGINHQLMSDD